MNGSEYIVTFLFDVVAVDSLRGSAYVVGYVSGNLDGQILTGASYSDIGLVKYDASGDWKWTRIRGATGSDFGYGG